MESIACGINTSTDVSSAVAYGCSENKKTKHLVVIELTFRLLNALLHREQEVFALFEQGLSDEQVRDALYLDPMTTDAPIQDAHALERDILLLRINYMLAEDSIEGKAFRKCFDYLLNKHRATYAPIEKERWAQIVPGGLPEKTLEMISRNGSRTSNILMELVLHEKARLDPEKAYRSLLFGFDC